jgi:hypothetical protein
VVNWFTSIGKSHNRSLFSTVSFSSTKVEITVYKSGNGETFIEQESLYLILPF